MSGATRFGLLAAVIALTLAAIMLAPAASQHRVLGQALLVIPVLLGIHLVGRGRSAKLVAPTLVLMAVALAFGTLAVLRGEPELLAADAVLHALVLAGVAAWVVRGVLRDDRVSLDTILGAICAYLLLGFLYANVFRAIHVIDPTSLSAAGRWLDPLVDRPAIFYFSYVTLTTVAYGDITPMSAAARFAAMTEGMIGQLYTAIFIARLVSLNVAQRAGRSTRE